MTERFHPFYRTCVSLLLAVLSALVAEGAEPRFTISGRVFDVESRQPVPYATVVVDGQVERGASADSLGMFVIESVRPGIYRLIASSIGYRSATTPEYIISASTPFIEIPIEADTTLLDAIYVTPSPFVRITSSPVSMRTISLGEIEKSAGANRDISRIVRSYPGVAYSPVGYRNDLIVRGGGPAENSFFVDGIEIPNINHFATLGASGGPVSILNADLIREIRFYTGAFPANRGGSLSSVLDFSLREGDTENQSFKATLGASEVGISGEGHIGKKTTYLFSARQSYLQLLFKLLGLPFLPNYIDAQAKFKVRINSQNELIFLGLCGVDNMRLNTNERGEQAEYLLSYLPDLQQETFTLGVVWRHYGGAHTQSLSFGYNYLNNRNTKYRNNDPSSPENLILKLRANEMKSTLRFENRSRIGRWQLMQGAEIALRNYSNHTYQQRYVTTLAPIDYSSRLDFPTMALFLTADYRSLNERLGVSLGVRADGSGYSPRMSRFWRQISPRISLSYALGEKWSLGGSGGLYYQLPPLTALGFREKGVLVNHSLEYLRVASAAVGVDFRHQRSLALSLEGFYKFYTHVPLSIADGIPLACKGNDYGTVGDELLRSTAEGRAFGAEFSARWQVVDKFNMVGSVTLYRSEYRKDHTSEYVASAWDNRFLVNLSGILSLPRNWSVAAKLSAIGGAPYTPYDEQVSSLKEYWDSYGRAAYDYSRYNSLRLKSFYQIDLRIDKEFYFRRWRLGLYVDLQNITLSHISLPDALVSTGIVANPAAPLSEQRYIMKRIKQESGTLVPTIGITAQF